MQETKAVTGSLVLYRTGPALVTGISDKIDISLPGGKSKRVRLKDISLLHPGPLQDFSDLDLGAVDVQEAWELISEESVNLRELAELIYGEYSPASAWGAWQRVAEGLYFEGCTESITAREKAKIEADIAERESKIAAQKDWSEFLDRVRKGVHLADDRERLKEIEQLALGRTQHSRIMAALDLPETAEAAHRALIRLGFWDPHFNPHPIRAGLATENPGTGVDTIPDESRRDLTHLPAFAIDDHGSEDPDDAISLEGDRIWVHVADVAAMVPPESEMDVVARGRAANLYLPERIVHMLPPALTGLLGLGLQQVSPALSFGFRLSALAEPVDLEIVPSWVKVRRLSYREAESLLEQSPFGIFMEWAERYRQRRLQAGAANLSLPETRVRVSPQGDIEISPLEKLASREMVTEFMLMTGEAVARYALTHQISVPFTIQAAPELKEIPLDMAGMFACRRQLKPSRQSTVEAPHSGLGIPAYTRVTSPLRRYMDLVTHQQLRSHIGHRSLLSKSDIADRIAISEPSSAAVRKAERLSNLHWKLVFLHFRPGWRGRAVVVARQERSLSLVVPELALETRIGGSHDFELNRELELVLRKVDIPDQMAWFKLT